MRKRENVTEEEIEVLTEKHRCEFLPAGIYYDGYSYMDNEGTRFQAHPCVEEFIAKFLEEENAKIGEMNRNIQKEWKNYEKKYEL